MSTLCISQKCCLSPDTSTAEPLITYTTVLGVAVGYIGAHIIAVCCSKVCVIGVCYSKIPVIALCYSEVHITGVCYCEVHVIGVCYSKVHVVAVCYREVQCHWCVLQ